MGWACLPIEWRLTSDRMWTMAACEVCRAFTPSRRTRAIMSDWCALATRIAAASATLAKSEVVAMVVARCRSYSSRSAAARSIGDMVDTCEIGVAGRKVLTGVGDGGGEVLELGPLSTLPD